MKKLIAMILTIALTAALAGGCGGTLGLQRLLRRQIPRFFAEEPPLKKADGPPGHDADALFFRQRPRIAEQFFDAFRFKAHGMAPHKSSLCAKGGGWIECIPQSCGNRFHCG